MSFWKANEQKQRNIFPKNPPFMWGEFKLLYFLAVMLWYSFAGNKSRQNDTEGETTTKVFIVDADF